MLNYFVEAKHYLVETWMLIVRIPCLQPICYSCQTQWEHWSCGFCGPTGQSQRYFLRFAAWNPRRKNPQNSLWETVVSLKLCIMRFLKLYIMPFLCLSHILLHGDLCMSLQFMYLSCLMYSYIYNVFIRIYFTSYIPLFR